MTAEVAVMNKQAIALAADSAVTFPQEMGRKIFPSASKIFTLSKYEPVGVMIYGNASLMGTPWETIIKVYRNNLGRSTFETVSEYAENFLDFLVTDEQLFSDEEQDWYVKRSIYSYFGLVKKEITESVQNVIDEKGKIDDKTTKELTSQIIKKHFEKWKKSESSSSLPEGFTGVLRQKYRNLISEAKKDTFESLPLTQHFSRQLTEIAINLFTKFPTGLVTSNHSGIVIAGFGTRETFPSVESFLVEAKIGNYLKHKQERSTNISFPNDAAIIPFAQSEMVVTFMEGVDPDYRSVIEAGVKQIYIAYPEILVDNIDCLNKKEKKELKNRLNEIGQKMFDEQRKELSNYRTEYHINPIMSVVAGLPKDELAAMAEALINLTSFKRRVSMEEETVGGPIDVAVISKGDGFVWIKRKHYFERELNQQFFANYYKGDDTNGTKTIQEAD